MKTVKLLLMLAWCLISLPLIFAKVPFILMASILDWIIVDEKKLKRMMDWKEQRGF